MSTYSQQSQDSTHKVNLFKQPYNGKNGAKAWLCIGTGAMIIGGTCQYLSTNPSINKNYLFYDQVISDKKTQQDLVLESE